jgi:hypothetical protein
VPAQGSDAFFSFGTDFPQVAASIIQTAEELGPRLNSALSSAGAGSSGDNLLKGLVGGVEQAGKLITDRVTALKGEIQRALVTGTAIPPGGLFGGASEAARQAATQMADTFTSTLRTLPANLQRTLGPQMARMAQELVAPLGNLASSAAVRAQGEILPGATSAGRLRETLGTGTPLGVGSTVAVRAQQEIDSAMTKLAADLQRGEAEAQQAFNELAQFRQLTAEAVHNLRSNPFVAQGENGRIAVTSPASGEQVVAGAGGFRVSGQSEAETLQSIATTQADALLTVQRAMEASAAATLRRAEVEQQATIADREATEASERKQRVLTGLAQGTAYPVGANAAFVPGEGFASPKTGALVTDANQIRVLTNQLAGSFDRLAEAEAVAARTPVDEFFRGLFGAGGRKYRGGARYDEESPNVFNGLAETAGVILKYSVLGTAFFKVFEDAKAAVEQLGLLDEAVAKFNEIVDAGTGSNVAFVNSIENLAQKAGELTTVALEEATRGVAAFSNSEQSPQQREQVGLNFAKYATQSQIISGGSTKENASDLISIGRAYELTASQLGDVTNAVANARKNLGADSQAVRQAMAIIAEGGREAGFSIIELSQSLGEIQARTAESGEAVASAFQRVLALFQGGGAQGLIRSIAEGFRAQGKVDIADSLETGSTKSRIQALAGVFKELSAAQRTQLGDGSRWSPSPEGDHPAADRQQVEIQKAIREATENTTEAQKQQNAILGSLAGQYRQFRALVRNIALDLARSGIADPLILAFGVIKEILQQVDRMIQAFDALPKPLREIPILLGEAFLLMKGIRALAASSGAAGALGIGRSVLATVPGGTLLARSVGVNLAKGGGAGGAAEASLRAEAAAASVAAAITAGGEQIAQAEAAVAAAQRAQAVAMKEGGAALVAANETVDAALRNQAAVLEAYNASVAEAMAGYRVVKTAENIATEASAVEVNAWSESLAIGGGRVTNALSALYLSVERAAVRIGTAASEAGVGGIAAGAGSRAVGLLRNPLAAGIGGAVLGQALGGGTGSLLLGGAAAFLPGGFTNPITAAIGVSLALKKEVDTITAVRDAINKAGDVREATTGTNADDLQKQADKLRSAADNIKHQSGGVFGSIFGAYGEVTGVTGNRGAEAAFDKRVAAGAEEQANLLREAQDKLTRSFSSGGVDFSAVDGVKNALDGMTKNGATATDQLNALNGALDNLATGGKLRRATCSRRVSPTSSPRRSPAASRRTSGTTPASSRTPSALTVDCAGSTTRS